MSIRDIVIRTAAEREALGEIVLAAGPGIAPALRRLGTDEVVALFAERDSAARVYSLVSYAPELAAHVLRLTDDKMQSDIASKLWHFGVKRELADACAAAVMRTLRGES